MPLPPLKSQCPLLAVFDMPTSIKFYCGLLGFEIVGQSEPAPDGHFDWCWLRLGDAELMLNTACEQSQRPEAPDPERIKAHGDTQIYFECQELEAASAFLREAGIEVMGPIVRPFGMKQMFFKDPDGYELCLQWRAETAR